MTLFIQAAESYLSRLKARYVTPYYTNIVLHMQSASSVKAESMQHYFFWHKTANTCTAACSCMHSFLNNGYIWAIAYTRAELRDTIRTSNWDKHKNHCIELNHTTDWILHDNGQQIIH